MQGQVGRAERADGSVGEGRAKETETSTFPEFTSLATSLERPSFLPSFLLAVRGGAGAGGEVRCIYDSVDTITDLLSLAGLLKYFFQVQSVMPKVEKFYQ